MELKVGKTEWDLSKLFKSDDDPKIAEQRKLMQEKVKEFIEKWKKRDDYLKEPGILKEALDDYESLLRKYGGGGNEEYYFWLKTQIDQNNPKLKAKFNQINELAKKLENETNFFVLRLAKIPGKEQAKFLDSNELNEYKHFLEMIFREAKHLLNEEEEKILNLKSTASHENWVKMTSEFLGKEEREVLTEKGIKEKKNFSEILEMMSSPDKKARDSAGEAFNDILSKNADVAEHEINSILLDKKVDDELRKMPRPDYSRHLSDDIKSELVDGLIKAVSKRFDLSKKYYKLKANLLGVKKLQYHERNVHYGNTKKEYTYEESVNMVYGVLRNLDEEFAKIFKGFVENGQIDVYPRKNKKMGGFCSFKLKDNPIFIMLNYVNNIDQIRVIAHETGHGINFELTKKQNMLNTRISLATAETASTFMEDFALKEVLKDADDELRLELMTMKLNEDVSSVMRQTACYMFEQELHKSFREKGYLSKEEIGKLFQKHMESYMGDSVEQSKGSENWWVYWWQIRRFFYNYSYASGLLISKAMQNSVKQNPKFIEKVKGFLSAGSSDSPESIFEKMGIKLDEKFWNKGLDEVENLLNETEKLAKKLGKI